MHRNCRLLYALYLSLIHRKKKHWHNHCFSVFVFCFNSVCSLLIPSWRRALNSHCSRDLCGKNTWPTCVLFLRTSFISQLAWSELVQCYLHRCWRIYCDRQMEEQEGWDVFSEVLKSSRRYVRNWLQPPCSPWKSQYQNVLGAKPNVILALLFVCSLALSKVSGNPLELFTELFTWSYRAEHQRPKLGSSC